LKRCVGPDHQEPRDWIAEGAGGSISKTLRQRRAYCLYQCRHRWLPAGL